MKSSAIALALTAALAVPAFGAPGEPRLVQGILEWPQNLVQTQHPVILVRGDDGALYYANITAAERRGAPTAGARIAVLGLEGKHANEVIAMLVTTNIQAERAPHVVAAPSGTASPGSPPPLAAVAPPPVAPAAPAAPPPPGDAAPSAGSATPSGAGVVEGSPTASAAVDTPRRLSEIQGVVQSVGRNTLVLKGEDGQRIVVDVSALGSGLAAGAAVGSVVRLYGVPIEQRFKASGFVETGARPK